MEWEQLDRALDDLESMICAGEGIRLDSFDARVTWAKAAEIQEQFRHIRYPSQGQREAAWIRFNSLRDQAAVRSQTARDSRFYKSKQWRDMIVPDARSAYYSFFADNLIPFNQIGVDGMKRMGETLREGWKRFNERKGEMIGAHKKECFEALREAEESQDRWWADYKASAEEGRKERISSNIEKLRVKLIGAYVTLQKMESAADDLRDKIGTAWSEAYTLRATGWLAELEGKIETHKEHIQRLESWLQEEENKL